MSFKREVITKYHLTEKELRFLCFNERAFTLREIQKKNGKTRILRIPYNKLRKIEKDALDYLYSFGIENKYLERQYAYTKKRNNIDYASKHKKRKIVIRFDVEDYFERITFPRIYGTLKKNGVKDEDALFISQIACYRNGSKHVALAQGSPLSPYISNLVSTSIDKFFVSYIKSFDDAIYTRYADDITISTNNVACAEKIKGDYVSIQSRMDKIGFRLNNRKTKQIRFGKKIIGGIKINEKLNLNKEYIDRIKLNIYFAKKDYQKTRDKYCELNQKFKHTENRDLYFENSLMGKINYLSNVKGDSDPIVLKLKKEFNSINEFSKKYDLRLQIENSVFPIVFDCGVKDTDGTYKSNGTIFRVSNGLISCYHILYDYVKKEEIHSNFKLIRKCKNNYQKEYTLNFCLSEIIENPNLYEIKYGLKIDKENDIVFVSNKYLSEHMTDFNEFISHTKPLEIEKAKRFYEQDSFFDFAIELGYPEGANGLYNYQEKETEIQYVKKYHKYLLKEHLDGGASGGPLMYNDKVIGIYKKGTEEQPEAEAACLFPILDFLNK